MPEDGKEDLPFETYCDLIERELREALEDIAAMRDNQFEAKRHCVLRPRRGHVRRCGFPMTEYLTYISHVRGDAVGDMEW